MLSSLLLAALAAALPVQAAPGKGTLDPGISPAFRDAWKAPERTVLASPVVEVALEPGCRTATSPWVMSCCFAPS
jgi:hypothetical protein